MIVNLSLQPNVTNVLHCLFNSWNHDYETHRQ